MKNTSNQQNLGDWKNDQEKGEIFFEFHWISIAYFLYSLIIGVH